MVWSENKEKLSFAKYLVGSGCVGIRKEAFAGSRAGIVQKKFLSMLRAKQDQHHFEATGSPFCNHKVKDYFEAYLSHHRVAFCFWQLFISPVQLFRMEAGDRGSRGRVWVVVVVGGGGG